MPVKTRRVSGEILLPAGVVPERARAVIVQVEDVSRADAPSVVVGEIRRANSSLRAGASLPFEVDVPEEAIDEQHSYSVRVHVDVSGSGEVEPGDLISTQSYPVLTRGHGTDARVRVRQI